MGDLVLLRSPHSSSSEQKLFRKFFPLYEGPYVITEVFDNNTLSLADDDREIGTYNRTNVKLYKEMA